MGPVQDDTFDVFIGYSSKDRKVADVVKAHLSDLGVKCWMAPESIKPGEEWAEAIANVVPRCGLMVLLWTRESMQSRQVINELTLADCSGVMILPFQLEDIQPEGAFKYYLSKTHWLDAVDAAWKAKIALLGERVLHNLEWENSVAGTPHGVRDRMRKASKKSILIWLVAACGVTAAGAIWIHWKMASQPLQPGAKTTESRALVFDPPSNVRLTPNGETLCSIRARQSINVFSKDGEWYKTDHRGGSGYIHQSQLRV